MMALLLQWSPFWSNFHFFPTVNQTLDQSLKKKGFEKVFHSEREGEKLIAKDLMKRFDGKREFDGKKEPQLRRLSPSLRRLRSYPSAQEKLL